VPRRFWRVLMVASMVAALGLALRPLAPGQGPENWFPYSDKLLHVGFFVLLWWLGRRAGIARRWLLALALLAFGAGIEIAQATLALTREASALDLMADAAGIALGWILMPRIAGATSSRKPEEDGR
jgi:VanZ family protein